jgi:hypothetical protein
LLIYALTGQGGGKIGFLITLVLPSILLACLELGLLRKFYGSKKNRAVSISLLTLANLSIVPIFLLMTVGAWRMTADELQRPL